MYRYDFLAGGYSYDAGNENRERRCHFPLTKQLVYYPDASDAWSAVMVEHYRIIEMYEITDRWYTLAITTKDGVTVKIHSDYFAEMQRTNFATER